MREISEFCLTGGSLKCSNTEVHEGMHKVSQRNTECGILLHLLCVFAPLCFTPAVSAAVKMHSDTSITQLLLQLKLRAIDRDQLKT
jgi:hypothetical protein